jgi:hypothetical protein
MFLLHVVNCSETPLKQVDTNVIQNEDTNLIENVDENLIDMNSKDIKDFNPENLNTATETISNMQKNRYPFDMKLPHKLDYEFHCDSLLGPKEFKIDAYVFKNNSNVEDQINVSINNVEVKTIFNNGDDGYTLKFQHMVN